LAFAIDQVDAWRESPTLVMLSGSGDCWSELRTMIDAGRVVGPQVHGARIAALCLQHGVREVGTADRDFNRFRRLMTRDRAAAISLTKSNRCYAAPDWARPELDCISPSSGAECGYRHAEQVQHLAPQVGKVNVEDLERLPKTDEAVPDSPVPTYLATLREYAH
jgi:hypothetical protein